MTRLMKRSPGEEIKIAIALLEQKRVEEKAILKEQFSLVADNLRPVNILKRTVHEIAGSFDFKNQLIHTGAGLLVGYFTRKVVVRSSSNPFLRLAGVALQYGVTNYISQNSDAVSNKILALFKKLTTKPV